MRNDMLVAVFSIFASAVTCAAAPLPTARELAESQGEWKSDYRAALGKCLYRAEAVERGGNFVSLPGILNPKRGTVICRVKRDDGASPRSRQVIFAFGGKGGDGSGRLSAYYDIAKGAVDRDSVNGVGGANINNVLLTSDWELTVVTWDETHSRYYSSSLMRPYSARPGGYSGSMKEAVKPPKEADFNPATPPDTLFIGRGADGKSALKGEIASFELYEGSLDDYEAEALISSKRKAHLEASRHYFREDELVDVLLELTPLNGFDVRGAELRLGPEKVPSAFRRRLPVGDYVFSAWKDGRELARDHVSVLRAGNPYVLPHDGHGEFEGLELIESVDVAAIAEGPAADNRFASVGKWSVGSLNGEKYVEAGPRNGDRFAVRFNVPADAPLCCIELVYPDDKRRTADIMVQETACGDETLAVGYAGGGGFELTNRMRSYKCLYWTAKSDVTAVVMTSFSGGPAALARINVYRVKAAGVRAASAALPPPAPDGGFRHSIAWWEDPVLFQLFHSKWKNAQELSDTIDRLAATMKFAGQDMLVYPGAFYSGLMDETEDPRRWSYAHPPHYFEALYAKFDEQGLCASPEINWQQWRFPRPEEVTPGSLTNGSLHATAISYATNGLPSAGVYTGNGCPTGHNVQHPQIQAELGRMFDYFIREGEAHPSFKGVTLFVTQMNPCAWGSIERGYNDYNIDAFEKATGRRVPVDHADPMRAEKYAKWLLTNAYDEWVAWRCDVVCDLYAALAEKLRAARPDLKLHVICQNVMDRRFDADFGMEGHERRLELEMGIDTAKLQARIPNLVVSKVIFPLRHRKRSNWFKTDERKNVYRDRALKSGFYNALYPAEYPGILLRDDFIESSTAGLKKTVGLFDAPWLNEISWRVSMWNPTGENAMKFHAVPLRFGDVLSLARGGYLIGSYGMEPLTAEFMRNFRALPAVKFDDLPSGEFVKLRQKDYAGRCWFYIVNTDDSPQTVEVEFPNGSVALADGANCEGRHRMTLAPYSIRSFSAPIGTKPKCCGTDNGF